MSGMARRARTVGKALWIATVPLAFTFLLSAPARSAEHGEADADVTVGEHGGGGHEIVENPILNWHDINYRDTNVHGGELQPGDEKMPPPFLAALTNFALLLFLVGRFAGPSMTRFVRERHDSIAKDLAEARRLREEAQQRFDEYTAKLAGLSAEIERLVREIRSEAEDDRARILAEAEARAARMKRDAEQQIQAEMERVKQLLERETVLEAVALAEKLIRERAKASEQRALADRFVKDLETRKVVREGVAKP